jgi:hypothetical protein
MSAGDLTIDEYDNCEAIAWRLVMACVRGPENADDGISLWHTAVDEIRHHDSMDAVLEVLAATLAERMVIDGAGRQNAARQVGANIAAALDRAAGAKGAD